MHIRWAWERYQIVPRNIAKNKKDKNKKDMVLSDNEIDLRYMDWITKSTSDICKMSKVDGLFCQKNDFW